MSNVLPPQANVFGFWDEDPRVVEAVHRHLEDQHDFARVWTPAAGWIAAAMPLPSGREPTESDPALAFAEGADVIGPLDRVRRLVDETPDRLDELTGDFGFIRFRPDGDATVVRSAAGLVPFYIRSTPTRVAVSTLIGDIVTYDPTEPTLDPLACAAWTTGYLLFPDGRSFVDGVRVVPPGHWTRVRKGSTATRRYWDPRPRELLPPDPERHMERARELRHALIDTLSRDLHPDGGNVVTLSGGVDSASVAAIAAGTAQRPVSSLSMVPPDGPSRDRELSYIVPLAEKFGFVDMWLCEMTRPRHVSMLSAAPHGTMPVVHPALNELPARAARSDVRVVFGGEFADETCGSRYTFVDWASHATARSMVHPPNGPRDWLRVVKWRTRWALRRPAFPYPHDLHEWFRPDLRAEWRQWRRDHQRQMAAQRSVWPYRWAWSYHDGWLAMNWEALSGRGIRRCYPFVRRSVLELAYQSHPAEIVGPPTKKLLKDAVEGLVPSENLHRPDKGTWVGLPPAVVEAPYPLPPAAAALLDPRVTIPRTVPVETAFMVRILAIAGAGVDGRRGPSGGLH